jgi:hypothetical protein
MNVIKVYGGLANQLFQYAFGQSQKKNGLNVVYEIKWFENTQVPPRPYALNKFDIPVEVGSFLNQKCINEVKIGFLNDRILLKLDGFNFFGYWQHPEYYDKILPWLKEHFHIRKEYHTEKFLRLREDILKEESVSLHVRRGDYVSINGHHLLPLEYYQKALKQVKGKVFVFSDDLRWCRKNFDDVTFVDIQDYLAFELMRCCNHHIIANSTFSWLAAYLEGNKGIVITPEQWRISKDAQSIMGDRFLLPKGWKQIKLKWMNH